MGANAQKEVSNKWFKQTIASKILEESLEAIWGMVNSQEDPTVEQMIVECQKENPNEKEEIAKIGEALTLEIENRKEKLESGVGDITHTFSDEFNNRVKVKKTIKPIQKGKTVSQRGGVQRTRDGEDE